MAGETTQIMFTHKDLVTALLRQQGIHEGIWGLYVNFGLGATNIGPTPEDVLPAAILTVIQVGIQKFPKESNIAVDASKVNPAPEVGQTPRKESGPRHRARS